MVSFAARVEVTSVEAQLGRAADTARVAWARRMGACAVCVIVHCMSTLAAVTAGYLSFHPMAQSVVHAFKGLAQPGACHSG